MAGLLQGCLPLLDWGEALGHINLTGDFHWRKDAGLPEPETTPSQGRRHILTCNF
ncbi:MAG: hypothetical protein M3Z32_04100 [Acidobacteriota bacterium]|nr:hypothetical protein [Acidobacteriota bacterium]